MSTQVTVMKFGGSSLEDGAAFERVTRIVCSYDRACSVVVVVSAMNRMTDALLLGAQKAASGALDEAVILLEAQRQRHLRVAENLPVDQAHSTQLFIQNDWQQLLQLLNVINATGTASARLRDAIASYGERLSATLLTAMLQREGCPAFYVDARRCILTNEHHGEAKPLFAATRRRTRAEIIPLLKAGTIPVLGGFIAATKKGVTTTLGRGSSDYTATLVSAALSAREAQIWTDVNGILTADPALIESARSVPLLSYAEAAELSRFGAKVIHPKTIQPAAEQNIPVRVFNSRAPELPGTLICEPQMDAPEHGIKAIAHKTGLTMIQINSKPEFMANGFRGVIEEIFQRHQTTVDIVATSETGALLACEETSAMPAIVQNLRKVGSVRVTRDRAIICCVGDGWWDDSDYAMNILFTVDPTVSWRRTSDVSLTADIPQDRAGALVSELHQRIFDSEPNEEQHISPDWATLAANF